MLVSVIIPTYNRSRFIRLTLESFINQNFDRNEFEIIIADNNSTDSTEEVVKSFIDSHRDYTIIYFVEPRQGVHYARNSAAKRSMGEYLYFTDDDMIADENLLEELLSLFRSDAKIASGTGTVLPKWEINPPDWILKLCNNALLSINNPAQEIIISNDDCNIFSCHQMMRRDIFFSSGGFNPENTKGEWIGDGETGLNIKIKELGFKFASNSKSVTHHIIPASRLTQKYLNKRLYNQGNCDTYSFYRKSKPGATGLIVNSFVALMKVFFNFAKWLIRFITFDIRWRLSLSYCYYNFARIRYNFRLLFDKNWRKLVLQDNWIDQ